MASFGLFDILQPPNTVNSNSEKLTPPPPYSTVYVYKQTAYTDQQFMFKNK